MQGELTEASDMCSLAPDKITPAGWARDAGVRAALTALATDDQPGQSVLSAAVTPQRE